MILSIIGIVLGVIAIGLVFWLKKDQEMTNALHEGDLEVEKHAYNLLMEDFTNYQVETDRKIIEFEKNMEIKGKNIDRQMEKAQKELPLQIGKIVSRVEFAQDRINR